MNNQGGFSLIGVMVGFALLGVLSIGVMRVTSSMKDSEVRISSAYDIVDIKREMRMLLDDDRNCRVSIAHKKADGNPAKSIADENLAEIKFKKEEHDDLLDETNGLNISLWLTNQYGDRLTKKLFNGENFPEDDDKSRFGDIRIKSIKLYFDNPTGHLSENYPIAFVFNDIASLVVTYSSRISVKNTRYGNFRISVNVFGHTNTHGESTLFGCNQNLSLSFP